MSKFDLTGTSEPWVIFVPQERPEIRQELTALEAKGGRVYHLKSRALTTEQGIFSSFADVLRFPGYFGRNWDAVVDCLGDLCGAATGRVGVAVVVHGADQLLKAEHFPLFVSVLCQGADRANSVVDLDGFSMGRPAIGEHFVLEFDEFDSAEIASRVRQPDLTITAGDRWVGAALNPAEWQ
ncbi:barstar family protein [Streptomyces sp. NPDC050534]|uniref:barstar family protein n=1 Tax=Streptomyces sp. NPDC050534 TaxID=3365625 RepID=UPI0037BCBB93